MLKFVNYLQPRATFIRNMISFYKWNDVSESQVGNKWDMMHRNYIETIKWKNETGQGVLEADGEETFHSRYLTIICL
jgi:hypothetical protein